MLTRTKSALLLLYCVRWLGHYVGADMNHMLFVCNGGGYVDCDADNDGHRSLNCGGTDCNDNDPNVFPDSQEICGDDKDNNCNGQIDEGCFEQGGYCVRHQTGTVCQTDVDCGGICLQGYKAGFVCADDLDCPPNSGLERGFCRFAAKACDSSPAAIPVPRPTTIPSHEPSSSPIASPSTAPSPFPTSSPAPHPVPSSEPTSQPTERPTPKPSSAPSPGVPSSVPSSAPTHVTYFPGDLTGGYRADLGLTLSRGLQGRRLTLGGSRVTLANKSRSTQTFHTKADGAGVISKANGNGWYYVSNSEVGSSGGGVGAIEFNAAGEVLGYRRILTGTSRNCGGGRTYWGTWITCEENGGSGRLYEVDPNTGYTQQIRAVDVGGNWESFAYDDQDPDVSARFYITEDWSYGALVRYTPAPAAFLTGNNYDILNTAGGTYEFLVLHANGTYSWSPSRSVGETSAETYYPNTEGIDIFNRQMFFTSKATKTLVQVDLAGNTYSITSTLSGQFDMEPDQLGRILESRGGNNDVLYFCEDGGTDSDIHGRDATGKYFTIVEGTDYNTETTGLTFSPDGMFLYVAYQGPSSIFAFWREDGLPFSGMIAGTKYH
ncbi:hypothetical protein FisN_4Lh316 [Fistulifera solaris]|uniref:Uncharacterized protein n=1 Tax=Fistulifera solaris TaxID=1519565 RepID=A0A1Z5KDL6_FISSO|nr:hypothetical protein FisN_4Lh316 [Fistulifera solaris]|eukprot:GAX24222.1 hypothetical protein FisN_4Lh316 [Fistulifera solaris]